MDNLVYVYNENIFDSECDVIVVPVNTVGVMGKGLAKQAAQRYPNMATAYKESCDDGQLKVGRASMVWKPESEKFRILLLPTKEHWSNPSKLEWIQLGVRSIVNLISIRKFDTIAIPAIGCGNGGLKWGDVLPVITAAVRLCPDVRFYIYPPQYTKE